MSGFEYCDTHCWTYNAGDKCPHCVKLGLLETHCADLADLLAQAQAEREAALDQRDGAVKLRKHADALLSRWLAPTGHPPLHAPGIQQETVDYLAKVQP